MQMKWSSSNNHDRLQEYITKSYYKTASLLSNSCRSAAILSAACDETQEIAFEFGKHLGLTFQVWALMLKMMIIWNPI